MCETKAWNFKQCKRDFCPFLKDILLRFFKKVYPQSLLCTKKKKEKLKQRNQMKKKKIKIKIAKEKQHWNISWQRNTT